ncbi:hypothetical protein ACFX15_013194 [Malus domestica]|nr:inactive protein RESTRICTED TEV MOVEMENT 2-like [Malus domestica]
MDSNGEVVNIIRSYEDFMPYCKFLKEERFDIYQIPLHGFKMEQFKLFVNDNKGTIKIEGQRPKGGSRWSRFRQKFKLPCNVYNTKDIHASFGNGVLTIILPKREPLMISNSDDKSDLFVYNGKLFRLKISKRGILGSIALVAVGVAVGGYVILKHLPSTHAAEKH